MSEANGPLFRTHFRRRRDVRTDYAKRLALLKSGKPRLVARKTNKYFIVQFVEFSANGDRVLATASSKDLLGACGFAGKCNAPSAYLTGALAAKRAAKKGVKEFVLDIGLQAPTQGGIVFVCCKGAADAGLQTSLDESILPAKERMEGKHLKLDEAFAKAKKKIMG
ncbi:50S ribosomal protein L18 [Candidatus Micrarchaeota archaeon]|nr:50S ribosomal protein L18 [Candidatus Micrarchaeota archaeon]